MKTKTVIVSGVLFGMLLALTFFNQSYSDISAAVNSHTIQSAGIEITSKFEPGAESVKSNRSSMSSVNEYFIGNAELARLQLNSNSNYHPKNIVFPDGSILTVQFNLSRRQNSRGSENPNNLDDGATGGFYERLSPVASEGNGEFAVYLAKELKKCLNMPKNDSELADRIHQAETSDLRYQKNIQLDRGVERLKIARARCDSVTDEMVAASQSFVRKSAELGHVESALMYAQIVGETAPQEAIKYYELAWKEGHLAGAIGLGEQYGKTINTHEDRIEAFAYAYAGKAATLSVFDGLEGRAIRVTTEKLHKELVELERSVPASISQPGTLRVKQLLTENGKCCTM